MDSARELARAVAQVKTVTVQGRFYRFIARQRLARALHGSPNGGRWGPRGGFPVLYLTDTYDGCVIEAYRHIVEPSEQDATAPPVGLALVTCDVEVSNIVDLTTATGRFTVGITARDGFGWFATRRPDRHVDPSGPIVVTRTADANHVRPHSRGACRSECARSRARDQFGPVRQRRRGTLL